MVVLLFSIFRLQRTITILLEYNITMGHENSHCGHVKEYVLWHCCLYLKNIFILGSNHAPGDNILAELMNRLVSEYLIFADLQITRKSLSISFVLLIGDMRVLDINSLVWILRAKICISTVTFYTSTGATTLAIPVGFWDRNKYHMIWLLIDEPIDQFKLLMQLT